MQMEYSADIVVAARSLQTYTVPSTATFWIYEYASSLQQELIFLLRSRWTKIKVLYIVTRYMPFLLFVGHLYCAFTLTLTSLQ
ncbi:hypothetical protein P692DRAFT_20830709 [Suillus brevipes Sb2]|nr:hypothetical protein P692DRAFT_20830709 [Suillus brevipes Sb2]